VYPRSLAIAWDTSLLALRVFLVTIQASTKQTARVNTIMITTGVRKGFRVSEFKREEAVLNGQLPPAGGGGGLVEVVGGDALLRDRSLLLE